MIDRKGPPIAELLRDLRVRSGLTMQEVALAAGYKGASSYQRYEDVNLFKGELLPLPLAMKLASLFAGKGVPPIRPEEVFRLAGISSTQTARGPLTYTKPPPPAADFSPALNVDLSRPPPVDPAAAATEMPRDVRVLGITVGGDDGDFELNGEIIDYVRRPPGIRGIAAVFALYIEGESMAPWKEPGDHVYVHPKRPVNINDYVLVELHPKPGETVGGAMVKRLARRTASEYILRQYNPPKDFRVSKDKVRCIYKILGDRDLYGT